MTKEAPTPAPARVFIPQERDGKMHYQWAQRREDFAQWEAIDPDWGDEPRGKVVEYVRTDVFPADYERGYRDGESSKLADLTLQADYAEDSGAPEKIFLLPADLDVSLDSASGGVAYVRADLFDKLLEERDELREQVTERADPFAAWAKEHTALQARVSKAEAERDEARRKLAFDEANHGAARQWVETLRHADSTTIGELYARARKLEAILDALVAYRETPDRDRDKFYWPDGRREDDSRFGYLLSAWERHRLALRMPPAELDEHLQGKAEGA